MSFAGRSVLVTGAHGLLGFWTTRALLEQGANVTVTRRDRVPNTALALTGLESEVTVVDADVADHAAMLRIVSNRQIDTVFHLAAQTIVGIANGSPMPTFETNVRGTWALLEACRLLEVPRVVVASSDKAYGAHEQLPYREDVALQPTFPYDASKAAADLIARSYFHTYGVPVAVTRCANLYGGGDLNRSRLIPEVIGAALEGRRPVIRSDGSPIRDWLYVEDAVAAYFTVVDALDAGPARGQAYNAGADDPKSVAEVVATVCEVAGTGVEPDIQGTGVPPGEIPAQYLDSSKLRALGWAPRHTLREGVERTIAWYREHPQVLGITAPGAQLD
jgi:CDP-glucose 4,6-dehydratase